MVPPGDGAVQPRRPAAGGLRPGPARAEPEVQELQRRCDPAPAPPRTRPRPALPAARAALPPALALRRAPGPSPEAAPSCPRPRRPVPGPESGRSGAVVVLNLIRKCKHQTGDMSSRLTAPGRRWPGAARMWAWPAGVGPTAVAPPTRLTGCDRALTGCDRPSPLGPPPSSEPPEGRAAPAPPARAPDPAPGAVLWGLLPGGWLPIEKGTGGHGAKPATRSPPGTTPLVGRSGTDVSGTQDSAASRWRRLSREGAWGPWGGGAERPRRALKTGPSTRSTASVSRLLGYQETPSSHDQNAAAPSVACSTGQQRPAAVAGAGPGQPPAATGAGCGQPPAAATGPGM